MEVTGAEIYFTGRVRNGEVRPVTVDGVNPYFLGADMAQIALNRCRETDRYVAKGVKVYRILECRAIAVPVPRKERR